MESLLQYYSQKQSIANLEVKKLSKQLTQLGVIRLLLFLGIVSCGYFLWGQNPWVLWSGIVGLVVAFFYSVKRYERKKTAQTIAKYRVSLFSKEIEVIDGKRDVFGDGEEFSNPTHRYAHDLDIFGNNSIFGWLNRANLKAGQSQLAQWLTNPILDSQKIILKQEAIKELELKEDLRQSLWVFTRQLKDEEESFNRLLNWAKHYKSQIQHPFHSIALVLFPVLSLAATISNGFDFLNFSQLLFVLVAPLIYYGIFIKKINQFSGPVSKTVTAFDGLKKIIQLIEKEDFKSNYLINNLKFFNASDSVSTKVAELTSLLERFDQRNNFLMAIPLNSYLLWDLRYALKMEKWFSENADEMEKWWTAIAQIEALSSFATIHFNHQDLVFPTLTEVPKISILEAGHPLIPSDELVTNDATLQTKEQIIVLTGANMAGKSTFLRALGVNLVLAMAGAKVKATNFEFLPTDLYTGMRTNDSLEEHTSYFFAELKRLSAIVKRLESGEHCFVLLDEILKGTNSKDKEEGSKKLIKRLLSLKGAGVIATHDLGLCSLENQYPNRVLNMAFETEIKNDELYFDYKLKKGICQTMNASFLLEKMGITRIEN